MIKVINTIFSSHNGFDTLPLRLGAGVIFAAHGAQKLFGWFGGYGLQGTARWMDSIGLQPGLVMATLAGSAEFFGGLLLILGLLVRPTAIILAFTMLVAAIAVHVEYGFFMANNGYEFALALFAASTAIAIRGAGALSIDQVISR